MALKPIALALLIIGLLLSIGEQILWEIVGSIGLDIGVT
jgi:hypothetical protein